jgi:hypothetical protein
MSGGWVAGAVAVTGIASGIMGSKAAKDAASSAAAASDYAAHAQLTLGREQLAYAKELQEKWEATFGPIQDSLSSYYQGLSADSEAARNLNALQQTYSSAKDTINKQLAQRGLSDSGLSATMTKELAFDKAKAETQAIMQAPVTVANQQMSFLGLGLGQQQANQQQTNSAYNTIGNVYANQQAAANQQLLAAQGQQASALGSIGSSIGSAAMLYGYMK